MFISCIFRGGRIAFGDPVRGETKRKSLLFASLIISAGSLSGLPSAILLGETKRKSLLFASLIKGLCFSFAFASKLATLRKTKPFQLSLKRLFLLSGWQDSNLRPSGPKPDALTGLRYTPKIIFIDRNFSNPSLFFIPFNFLLNLTWLQIWFQILSTILDSQGIYALVDRFLSLIMSIYSFFKIFSLSNIIPFTFL